MHYFIELPNKGKFETYFISIFFSKKDPEVMKRAIDTLSWPLSESSVGVNVQKKAINTCTQLYPVVLKWAAQKKTDREVEACWLKFCNLKGRIMQTLDSNNEGYNFVHFFKFS